MSTSKRTIPDTKAPKNSGNRVETVKNFLKEHYEIKINVFDPKKSFIVCNNPDRYNSAIKIEDLSLHMEEQGIRGCDSILKKIIASPNQITIFNPIVDFVNSLDGVWKGESMIEKLCSYISVREFPGQEPGFYHERFKRLFRKWGACAVATVIGTDQKRDKNDAVFGFIHADEGIGKSTLLEFLVPEQMKSYYQKSDKDPRYFDLTKAFTSNLIINFDDNVGLTRNNAEPIKAALSAKNFKINRYFEDTAARMASGLVSSNKTAEMGGFLLPELGTRRWALVELDKINQEYSEKVDVMQLWAEFYVLYKTADFNYIWDQDDFNEFGEYNMRYMVETNAKKLIREFYRKPEVTDDAEIIVFKQPIEILQELRAARKITTSMSNISEVTIGFALKSIGYERSAQRKDKLNSRYGYNVVQLY